MGKVSSAFDLFLEKGGGEKILVIRAVKKKFTMNNYFLIQLDAEKNIARESDKCLGKLRALNNEKD